MYIVNIYIVNIYSRNINLLKMQIVKTFVQRIFTLCMADRVFVSIRLVLTNVSKLLIFVQMTSYYVDASERGNMLICIKKEIRLNKLHWASKRNTTKEKIITKKKQWQDIKLNKVFVDFEE